MPITCDLMVIGNRKALARATEAKRRKKKTENKKWTIGKVMEGNWV